MTRYQHHHSRRQLDREAARLLVLETGEWLSCDDCFEQVDTAVEDVVLRRTGLTPAFRAHLQGCPACREEAATLAALVAQDSGQDATTALRRLDRALQP